MKNKKFYRIEKINYGMLVLIMIPICIIIFITSLKISSPTGFAPYGYEVAMAFLSLCLIFSFFIYYFEYYRERKRFLIRKQEILNNGICVQGKIIDSKCKNYYYGYNNQGKRVIGYHYYVLVEFKYKEEILTYWTPEVSFNPQKLISNDVLVYTYEDKYFVDDFKIKLRDNL